jgi:hypothetical protein
VKLSDSVLCTKMSINKGEQAAWLQGLRLQWVTLGASHPAASSTSITSCNLPV